MHPKSSDEFQLHVPKFEVKPGEVVAIVGRVGSGKSSVFQAILQNMELRSGVLQVRAAPPAPTPPLASP